MRVGVVAVRKVIGGRVFDTATADLVSEEWSDVPRSDFRYWHEALYRSPRGRWFLVGEGGGLSRWAVQSGDSWLDGSGMRVLSEADALEWCERNGVDLQLIEQYFEVEEG